MPKAQKIRLYGLSCDIGEPPEKVEINTARQPCVPLEHQGTPGELEINASR